MPRLAYAQRLAQASQITVVPQSLPAPIKGWNTRDALDEMDPLDAVQLDNWYPDAGGCVVRNGYTSYCVCGTAAAFSNGFSNGFQFQNLETNPVKTLATYNFGATSKFLAAAGGKFYDVSSSGFSGAAIKSGFTSDLWQWAPFLQKLFFVNGQDTPQVYNGSTFSDTTFTGSGLTTTNLVGVITYQNRLFFWEKNSPGFWYAPLNAITGTLTFYDLSAFAPHGGNLTASVTFSHDGGNGVVDFVAFIMSSGDTLIYSGNDPGNANVWSLVGIYRLSPPVNIRSVCQYGAEAFMTTFDDHVPMQQQLVALKLGSLPPRSKVSKAVQEAVMANPLGTGWQALYYPAGRRLIFNIPNPDGTFSQHICNTSLADQPWCRFIGMNAWCWGIHNNNLYFGAANGTVYQADIGTDDVTGAITATAQQAWNRFDSPLRKRVTAVNPLIESLGGAGISLSIGFDYGAINLQSAIAIAPTGSPWDTSPWDTSPWSAEILVSPQWYVQGGSGVAVGVALQASVLEATSWLRTDFRAEIGNAL